jgi:hypothetical protein
VRLILCCSGFGIGLDSVLNYTLASSKLCCKLPHGHPLLVLCDDFMTRCRTNFWTTAHILIYFLSQSALCGHSCGALKLWYWCCRSVVGKIAV